MFLQDDAPWASEKQLVVPTSYRKPLLQLAHDGHFSGYMGGLKDVPQVATEFLLAWDATGCLSAL